MVKLLRFQRLSGFVSMHAYGLSVLAGVFTAIVTAAAVSTVGQEAATPFVSVQAEQAAQFQTASAIQDTPVQAAANSAAGTSGTSGQSSGGSSTSSGGSSSSSGSTAGGTYIGANPANPGGSSNSAATTVITKWGSGAAIRQFVGSDLSTGPHHPAGATIVHTSYKPDVTSVNSGALDAQIEALINRTPAGDVIEFWHEPNNDGLTGSGITNMINAKNRLYEIKQRIKPSVLVGATMTGGFFANYTAESTRAPWYGLKGDILGVDADGVHDSTGPSYDISYVDEIAGVKTFMTRNPSAGWKGWAVPEHGTSRQPWDTTGNPRASWFQTQTKLFIDGGAHYVMLYDYNSGSHVTSTDYNQIYAGTPEYTVWKNLIDTNRH